jgi:penicillin-binding protein 2
MRGSYSSNGIERRQRSFVLGTIGLILLTILVGRLFFLQMVSSERSRELAKRNWLKPEYVPGPRGRILDRNGVVLAEMVPSFAIAIDPQSEVYIKGPEELDRTLERLARLIQGDVEEYREQIDRNRRRTYNPIRLERNAGSSMVARVEENRIDLPGVTVEVEPTRRYPSDSLAAHVLGYIGEIGEKELESLADRGYRPGALTGKTGIELQYEEVLRGEDGIRFVEVNALGRRSEAFNREQPVPPRPGRDVVLSLDARVQAAAERALQGAGYDGEGDPPEVRGSCVLMDVRNGEVLAMASNPGFDVNVFSRSISTEEWKHLTREAHPLLNRAIQSAYPPGSVFKPLTQYAAFEEGVIQPGQYLSPCFGGHQFGNRYFRCWKRNGHGAVNDLDALSQSCDVYFYQLAPVLGVDGIARYANLFRIQERTGIDLPQERKGLVPDSNYYDERFGKKKWSSGVALNLIIGQGEIQLTPLQLVQFIAVVATGGRQVTPRLLKDLGPETRIGNHPAPDLQPRIRQITLGEASLRRVREGLVIAVESGTARNAAVINNTVAGKTGTAENPGFDHAVFIAYAPVEQPQVAVAVFLENRGHGGSVAAPVARKVLASYFGVPDSLVARVVETD